MRWRPPARSGNEACRIIYKMCTAKGNLYAVQKAIIRLQGGPDAGSVRLPCPLWPTETHPSCGKRQG